MVRTAASLLIAISMARATDPEVTAVARRIASVQSRLPWFGPPDAEGMADVPYAREERLKRSRPRPRGSALADWASITLERIPLDWGSDLRCVECDGKVPCPIEWIEELKKQSARRDQYSAEPKSAVLAARSERRASRHQFWDSFPDGMRIPELGRTGCDSSRGIPVIRSMASSSTTPRRSN